MKNVIIKIVFLLLSILCISILLVGCDIATKHKHSYESDFSGDGTNHWKSCDSCDEKADLSSHSYSDWETNIINCETNVTNLRHCAHCDYQQIQISSKAHNYSDWKWLQEDNLSFNVKNCKDCNHQNRIEVSSGLIYNRNSIVGAEQIEGDIVIPYVSNTNHPVTRIDNYALRTQQKITSVTMPDTVVYIGRDAFENCISLKTIYISKNLIELGSRAFMNCVSLEAVVLPDDIEIIENSVFENCEKIAAFNIPSAVTRIEDKSFKNTSLRNVYLTSQVNHIGEKAFADCINMERLIIPLTVKTIENAAFLNTGEMKLFAEATAEPTEGWENHMSGYWNMGSNEIYWYSETPKSASNKDYWYYNAQKDPTLWD